MIRDPVLVKLVDEQTHLFNTDAPMDQKEAKLLEIKERQKFLKSLSD